MSIPRWWVVTVGGGYGSYAVFDTKENAEAMRAAKANWEGAVAQLRHLDQRKPEDRAMLQRAKSLILSEGAALAQTKESP